MCKELFQSFTYILFCILQRNSLRGSYHFCIHFKYEETGLFRLYNIPKGTHLLTQNLVVMALTMQKFWPF